MFYILFLGVCLIVSVCDAIAIVSFTCRSEFYKYSCKENLVVVFLELNLTSASLRRGCGSRAEVRGVGSSH